MNNGDKTAFPSRVDLPDGTEYFMGLSRRELFAAMAMQGIIKEGSEHYHHEVVALQTGLAVAYADALLEALEQ